MAAARKGFPAGAFGVEGASSVGDSASVFPPSSSRKAHLAALWLSIPRSEFHLMLWESHAWDEGFEDPSGLRKVPRNCTTRRFNAVTNVIPCP